MIESGEPTPSIPELTGSQGATLLGVASDAIGTVLRTGSMTRTDAARYEPELRAPGATFVTLERDGALLGCIGTLEPVRPLVADVAHNAVAAAFGDPRLEPIRHDDYAIMSIEVSLLGTLEPVPATSFDELSHRVRAGTDGLVVDAPAGRATFLPAVWRHFGEDVDAFLGALWHKAGLPSGSWERGTRCSRYAAVKLVDPGPRPGVGAATTSR